MSNIAQPPLMEAAFTKATTWGTAVSPDAAGKRFPFLTESIETNVERALNASNNGSILQLKEESGRQFWSGSITCVLDFEALDLLIAQVMGTAGTPSLVAGTVYTNTLSLNDCLRSIFGTLAFEKDIDLVEYDSVKVMGLHLVGEANQPWQVTFDIMARYEGFDSSATYGATATGLSSATYSNSSPKRIIWANSAKTIFRIDDQSTGALDASDNVYPNRFTLDVVRPMAEIFTNQNAPYMDEPADNGHIEITGTLEFPIWENITLIESLRGDTLKKMSVLLSGEEISGGNDYEFFIQIPQLQITQAPHNIGGPEVVPHPVEFRATKAAANPTGFTDTSLYIEQQNERSASPLA